MGFTPARSVLKQEAAAKISQHVVQLFRVRALTNTVHYTWRIMIHIT